MFKDKKLAQKTFEEMKLALSQVVLADVGKTLQEQSEKSQEEVNKKLFERIDAFEKQVRITTHEIVKEELDDLIEMKLRKIKDRI